MFHVSFKKQIFNFKKPASTSRGVLQEKISYFITLTNARTGIKGIGECSLLPRLSPDLLAPLETELERLCEEADKHQNPGDLDIPDTLPAVRFAFETAWLDLKGGGKGTLFVNSFSRGERGIPINGLIWMAEPEQMWKEVVQKIHQYPCIKMKVGALDFEQELSLLERIRNTYGQEVEIRLDANGAFSSSEALAKLERLSVFNIHSIEQPIKQGQWIEMADVCRYSPIPIALDEELIGQSQHKAGLLELVHPQYIILKPSLLGGLAQSDEWIARAEKLNIGWWTTSALESNVGLNAIAQWVAEKTTAMPQGLGTGALYEKNIEMGLEVRDGKLWKKES